MTKIHWKTSRSNLCWVLSATLGVSCWFLTVTVTVPWTARLKGGWERLVNKLWLCLKWVKGGGGGEAGSVSGAGSADSGGARFIHLTTRRITDYATIDVCLQVTPLSPSLSLSPLLSPFPSLPPASLSPSATVAVCAPHLAFFICLCCTFHFSLLPICLTHTPRISATPPSLPTTHCLASCSINVFLFLRFSSVSFALFFALFLVLRWA